MEEICKKAADAGLTGLELDALVDLEVRETDLAYSAYLALRAEGAEEIPDRSYGADAGATALKVRGREGMAEEEGGGVDLILTGATVLVRMRSDLLHRRGEAPRWQIL